MYLERHNQKSSNGYFQHYNYSYGSGYFKLQYKYKLLHGITGILTFFCAAAVAAGASLLVAGVTFLKMLSFPDPDSGVCSLFDLSGENQQFRKFWSNQ